MSPVAVVVVALVLGVVVLGLGVALRGPVQRRLYRGTGLQEWRAVAREQSWADRWTLYRASIRGKAVRPGLAGLAVQRGEMVVAVNERMLGRSSGQRRLWVIAGVLYVLSAGLHVPGLLDADASIADWVGTFGFLAGGAAFLTAVPQTRRTLRRARRGVELNRAQFDPSSTGAR